MFNALTRMRRPLVAALALGLVVPLVGMGGADGGGDYGMIEVTVTIENLAPDDGNYLTPVWVGFHNGRFDIYDRREAASEELESLAEDGNTAPLMKLFDNAGYGNTQATILSDEGIPPLAPGETATMTFTLNRRDRHNRYFSYASMVIPSNDAFIANSHPRSHRIFTRGGRFRGADFIVWGGSVNDAGTELNDEEPMNTAFFGQATPDTGQDEAVGIHDHPGLKFPGAGGIVDSPDFTNADFSGHGRAVARITIRRNY